MADNTECSGHGSGGTAGKGPRGGREADTSGLASMIRHSPCRQATGNFFVDMPTGPLTMWTDQSVSFESAFHERYDDEENEDGAARTRTILARKEEILRTATELFAEQGFSDAITQALADRLGVGKGTIYRHFPSKRELFLAAADRVMRKMQEQILANIAGIEDGLEQVARGIMAFLSFFADHPEYVELLIQERAQFKDRKRPTYFEHREVNVAAVAASSTRG